MTIDCDKIPTIEDIENAKDAMDDIQSFTYLPDDDFVDAKGTSRDTVNGRLKKMGYQVPVIYSGGISFTINDNVKTVEESGNVYAPLPSALPFTTTGTWGVIGVSGDNLKFFVLPSGVFNESSKIKIPIVQDVKVYNYPANVTNVFNVVISGKILMESATAPDKDYTNDPIGKKITLEENPSTEETMEFWVDEFPVMSPSYSVESTTFDFASSGTLVSLRNVSTFVTLDGLITGDNFGDKFGKTGITDVSKAGTIDIDSGKLYDPDGREFKAVGEKIRLETLGLVYATASAVTLGHIDNLRINGFRPDIATEYSLTVFNGAKNVNINGKEIIAHRCLGLSFPENTTIAFTMAIDALRGQNIAMECDVQIALTGEDMVVHDQNVDSDFFADDGVTPVTGDIKSKTFAELRSYKYKTVIDTAFEEGVRIPKFDDFVRLAAKYSVKIYPEIKGYRTQADIEIMVATVQKYNHSHLTIFTSFILSDLQAVRQYDQQVGVGLAKETALTVEEINQLKAVGNVTMIWPATGVDGLISNPSYVTDFFAAGFDIAAWTVTRQEIMQDLSDLGIHKIMTDVNVTPTTPFVSVDLEPRFNAGGWTEVGAGSKVYTANPENDQTIGDIVTLEGDAVTESVLTHAYNVSGGGWVEFKVLARNFGAHTGNAQIDIDSPYGTRKDTVNVLFDDWALYSIGFQADINEGFAAQQITFNIGSVGTEDSGGQFYRPRLQGSSDAFAFRRCLMHGALIIAQGDVAGVHVLHTNTRDYNVDTILPLNTSEIEIRPHKEANLTAAGTPKGIFAQSDVKPWDRGQVLQELLFTSDCNNPQGTLNIQATEGGVAVNLNTITVEHIVSFSIWL